MTQDPILLKLLSDAGLDTKESRVYLALLEFGQTTVQQISKTSGLKRPIIYVILEELIERGFATELPNKKIRTYQATDPSAISAQLQMTAKNFSDMLPIFKTLANRAQHKPKISFFDTKDGILKIYDEINRQKTAAFIASFSRLEEHFPGASTAWQRNYQKNFTRLQSRTIIPHYEKDVAIAKAFLKITDKVKVRSLNCFNECDMDLTVYGNKLAITTFEEKPFLVVIESDAVPTFFLPIFDILWRSAKKI